MNWGNKLAFAMIAFMAFIGYMAYRIMQENFDLVSETYYEDEMEFQQVLDSKNALNLLSEPLTISKRNDSLILDFPKELVGQSLIGTVDLVFAPNKINDQHLSFNQVLQSEELSMALTTAVRGKYGVKLIFTSGEKAYFFEDIINL